MAALREPFFIFSVFNVERQENNRWNGHGEQKAR